MATRSRKYDNGWTVKGLTIDEAAFVKARAAKAGLANSVPEGCSTVAALVEALDGLAEAPADAVTLAGELREFDLGEAVRNSLRELYPSFLYFDVYSALPGRVSIPRLQQHEADLDSGERTALALLRLAGVATDDFAEEDYEARRAALEAASNVITECFVMYDRIYAPHTQPRAPRRAREAFVEPVGPFPRCGEARSSAL